MCASAIFIMDTKGKVIMSRNYRGDLPMTIVERFTKHITDDEENALTPVVFDEGNTFLYIRHNGLIFMAVTKSNTNALVVLNFLYRMVGVFEEYFNEVNEESIHDNFVIMYELFDEMMDFGYPQCTEAKILQEFIQVQERHRYVSGEVPKPPEALTQSVSWRKAGIVHSKNEIFLDVVEKLNLLVASNGTVLRSEVLGSLKMKSFLSGIPELKLGLNDKIVMDARNRAAAAKGNKSVDMEDIRFHQCVRLSRFENDRTISFIPPDGEFDLMTYRLNTQVKPLIWIDCQFERHSRSRVEYVLKAKSTFKRKSTANNVEIFLPVPSDADSPDFKTSIGKAEYVPEREGLVWKIKQFQGQKEFIMRAQFGLPSVSSDEPTDKKAPINVSFEIPYFTVSGIQVRYLKIMERSGYQALPWVRYITQNGDYQIRI